MFRQVVRRTALEEREFWPLVQLTADLDEVFFDVGIDLSERLMKVRGHRIILSN